MTGDTTFHLVIVPDEPAPRLLRDADIADWLASELERRGWIDDYRIEELALEERPFGPDEAIAEATR